MRDFQKFGLQFQYDINSLLDEKYDQAIIGVDYTTTKFVYDIKKLQNIIKQNTKADQNQISNIMDQELFRRQNKPVYLESVNKKDIDGYLKIANLLRKSKQ